MKLAIVILNKSNNIMLFDCLNSIIEKTKNLDYHIYIGDTGSTDDEISDIIDFLKTKFKKEKNATFINISHYNFAKNNNLIVRKFLKDEELILFCNNDIKLIDDCVNEAVNEFKLNENLGTIGFKLLFRNNTIQHAGQLLFLKDNLFYQITHRGLNQNKNLFDEKEFVVGNTGALMMTTKKLFNQIGGFNESYKDCFEDVEYNLQCLLLNRQNLYIPKIAMHYESITRNKNKNKESLLQEDAWYVLIPFINKNNEYFSKLEISTIINK